MRPAINLMVLLDRHGSLSATEAKEMLGLSKSQIGKKAHNLVGRGWVKTARDPDDKRVVLFSLTRAGRKVLDEQGVEA